MADGLAVQTSDGIGVNATSTIDVGVWGESQATPADRAKGYWCNGVVAISASAAGLYASSGNGPGVVGVSEGGRGLHPGVYGDSSNIGVFGRSDTGLGVFGASTSSVLAAVRGDSDRYTGVEGISYATDPETAGVHGYSYSSNGVYGYSHNSVGVLGVTRSFNGLGGLFAGGLVCMWGPKAAAVPHRDGSMRLLYSMESPESWFEDFGRARLVRGRARVKLDREFSAVIHTGDYHVFLTPQGDSRGLYVSRKTRTGFEVREQQGGTSSLAFSYRVVGRRKDIRAPRFQKLAIRGLQIEKLRTPPRRIKPTELTQLLATVRRPRRAVSSARGVSGARKSRRTRRPSRPRR